MLESIMTQKHIAAQRIITLKAVLSVGLIALAVLLPQIVHIAPGQPGGVQLLPMYLPVLIGGCLLGWKWALAVAYSPPLSALRSPL